MNRELTDEEADILTKAGYHPDEWYENANTLLNKMFSIVGHSEYYVTTQVLLSDISDLEYVEITILYDHFKELIKGGVIDGMP